MKKYINKTITVYISILFLLLMSCETTDLDLLDNPSELGTSVASLDKFFNSVQLQFVAVFEEASTFGMDVSRMTQMGSSGTYQNNYSDSDFNDLWVYAYADFLKDAQITKQLALDDGNIHAVAVVQILESYILMTLVDYFSDIPYSEALVSGNLNPNRDEGEMVYAEAKKLLLDAKLKLSEESLPLNNLNDFYYDGNISKWKKLVNTMLIRYSLQTKHVNTNAWSEINNLIIADDYISNSNDNFVFHWSSNTNNSDDRHPKFGLNYDNIQPIGFLSNYYMWLMHVEKGFDDPRINYYFYRKTGAIPTSSTNLVCLSQTPPPHYNLDNYPFCNAGDGYIGRDHGMSQSTGQNSVFLTLFGIYPVGGKFDDASFNGFPGASAGLAGAGISPILTASSVNFMIAEASLSLNNDSSMAKQHLLEGITKSMNEVRQFSSSNMTTSAVNEYITYIENQYDEINSNKLDIIMKEWFLAGFGNGIDSYNNYRRTGLPKNIQPSIEQNPGSYMNVFLYPANHVANNSNASQRNTVGEKVFWAKPTIFNINF